MIRRELYDSDGTFTKIIEIEHVGGGTVKYREMEPDGTLIVERDATAEEIERLRQKRESEEKQAKREQAEQALDNLETIANSSGDLTQTQLSDSVRVIARTLAALIRFLFRKLDVTL